ncbi:MAG: MBL fold metallo-hydrolase [Phycisphaeraceae bacterium]
MFFHQRFVPGLSIMSYLVGDEKSGQAAVIDPTRDVDEYLRIADEHGLTIAHILETHVHADFVSGSVELKQRLNGEPTIHCSGLGGDEWTPPYADHVVQDGDVVTLGRLHLQAMHTPGHTPEHISWALYDASRSTEDPWLLFTGDFLFVGDVGRPDLLGAEAQQQLAHQLYRSVFERLAGLPDHVEVYPGHGPGSLCGKAIGSRLASTLGYERRHSPALQQQPEQQWTQALLENMPQAPAYFKRMKRINAVGPESIGRDLPGQRALRVDDVRERLDTHLVLDIRSKEAFAAAHIPGAINIALEGSFPTWAGWILPHDRPMVLVADHADDVRDATRHLIRIGLERINGYLKDGMTAWETAGERVARLEPVSVHELHHRLERPSDAPLVLDVRTDAEWNAGHIDGALHIHGGELPNRLDEVPADQPVAVVCGSGYRASIAASLLKGRGDAHVMNVLGGMTAWQAADLPTIPARKQAA